MTIRRATPADLPAVLALWEAFERELPEPPHRAGAADERAEVAALVERGLALLAEEGGTPVGLALARVEPPRICFLSDLYVVPDARRRGIGKALVAAVAAWGREQGAEVMTLEVLDRDREARAMYERLGFEVELVTLVAPLDALAARLAGEGRGASQGAIHVQTDDVEAVARAVRQYVPRLPGGSQGSVVVPSQGGWTTVHDELCDREPAMLRRLALELSDRMGAVVLALGIEEGEVVRYVLFERGSVVDEYCSVPEYHGPLPPGDVVALGANPRVLARLTGADPARIREVARTASRPSELPPAPELLAELAAIVGIAGAGRTYEQARAVEGALVLHR